MNTRERFVKCVSFQSVDHVPCVEIGAWGQARDRWLREGMPQEGTQFNVLKAAPHFGLEHFDELRFEVLACPAFTRETVAEDERTETFRDRDGALRKALKEGMGESHHTRASMDQFLMFAVESRQDFLQLKKRFDLGDARRFPATWAEQLHTHTERSYPLCLAPFGTFGLYSILRRYMGTENACTVFYDDPKLAEEMLDFFTGFFIELSSRVLDQVAPDYFMYFEDFAFKTGPLVSPKIFRGFLLPRYKQINEHLRSRGIDIIAFDSDGNIEVLLPMMAEAGINFILPMEQAAGMDAVRIRGEYGNTFAMLGSIDKRELAKGKAEIEREVLRQVPQLLASGGYIPTVDHTVPPDVPYGNFLHYLDVKRRVTG